MATEKFEDRRLTGSVKVTCKFEDGTVRVWDADKAEVVQHIVDIVDEMQQDNYVITLRQLHYQLVKSNWIVNHISAYKKLGDILDDCRYAGVIDWDAIEDRGRVPHLQYSVDSIAEALQDTVDSYKRNRQEKQRVNVELWTEKDALSGILQRVTNKYHIRLVVNKGYSSSSAMYRSYKRILRSAGEQQKTTILYLGDHDPSGLDMVRDIRERLTFMMKNGRFNLQGDYFSVNHIGLTMSQIRQYDLPPNPAKMTDARAEKYIEQFGRECWEVDALNPRTLVALVEKHIRAAINTRLFDEVVAEENRERERLQEFIDNSKNTQ
jgi:hypothetical protein